MRIGIISNLYPPYIRGGAENVVVRTVEELTFLNHDVFVISSKPKDRLRGISKDSQTTERVYRFFPKNLYYILDDNKYLWPIRLIWHVIDSITWYGVHKVYTILREEEPEVMITHNLKGIGLGVAKEIQRQQIPHIHIVHDLQLIYPSGLLFAGKEKISLFLKPFYFFYRVICKYQLGKPDLVIFPSQYLKDVYLNFGFFENTEVTVMPNPAPRFTPIERGDRTPGPLRLLFVGQLEEHKGIQFLIKSLRNSNINFQLIIAGEGTLKKWLKKIGSKDKRIIYLGYVSLEQLVNCFGLADALIVPSLCYENSPTVIYESLNAGVPVIASDIGGVGELVDHLENGYLFAPGDTQNLLSLIGRLDERKERAVELHSDIKKTVAPHALHLYAQRLLQYANIVIEKKQKQLLNQKP